MSLLRQGKAQALTIYLGESDQWQGRSLYVAIIQYLREQGCAGATGTRAIASYGAGARLHESDGLRWSSDASIIIQVVDQQARLHCLLPHLQEMHGSGLMMLHEVEVLKYTHARLGKPLLEAGHKKLLIDTCVRHQEPLASKRFLRSWDSVRVRSITRII
ncbi:MAG: DUF190 domain-containing protein [Ktedonobacteraceae bacterium]|nr:DUF190 domain-containing protein [Ktedonobacteraceae bacterium]